MVVHHQLLVLLLIATQGLKDPASCRSWCLHLVRSLNRLLLGLVRKSLVINHLHEAWVDAVGLHHLLDVLLVSGHLTCTLRGSSECVKVYIKRHRRLTSRVRGGLGYQLIYSV